MTPVERLPKYLRAELRASWNHTENQRQAFGARLFFHELRDKITDRKSFAIACIRLQTWY